MSARSRAISRAMPKRTTRVLYDAFPTKDGAYNAMASLVSSGCSPRVRKLAKPQDGGRLKYGVYVAKSCRL